MINKDKIQEGVRLLLEGLGEDVKREGLLDTPQRVANMFEEIYHGYEEDASIPLGKIFVANNNEIILERDIPFYSVCEHHMMPFFGKAHIAYIPDGKVVGLSKMARTLEVYAKRLQIQEQLTSQVAQAFMEHLKPKGVMVIIEAEHLCMSMRGVKKAGTTTISYVTKGVFEENSDLVNRVFQMV